MGLNFFSVTKKCSENIKKKARRLIHLKPDNFRTISLNNNKFDLYSSTGYPLPLWFSFSEKRLRLEYKALCVLFKYTTNKWYE